MHLEKFAWRTIFIPAILGIAHAAPKVFWASDPIHPGETALLFGDDIGPGATAEGWRVEESGAPPRARPLQVLQASSVSAKVVIPEDWKPGLFAVRLRNASGASEPVWLNRPEAWWWLGDEGHKIIPGGEIRVFGKNFGPGIRGWIESAGNKLPLVLREAAPYAARFWVPDGVPQGACMLRISGSPGGMARGYEEGGAPRADAEATVSPPLAAEVANRQPWPSAIFDVQKSGAKGDGVQDDTAAFLAALAKAGANGGGIVFIPRGNYRISAKLVIPPHTVLRGEKREAVWLFSPKDAPEFDAMIAGNRDFTVEDLSIVSQTAQRLVACPDQKSIYAKPHGTDPSSIDNAASNVRLRRLRLQHLAYAHRLNRGDPRREIAEGPATVVMSGYDLALTDSEVISSGMPIAIHGGHRLRLERNALATGRNGWYGLWDTSEAVFEGNKIEGRDLEASFGGFQRESYRIYYANNTVGPAFGNEREALTFDSPYAPRWMGRAANAEGRTLQAREYDGSAKAWKPGELKGEACLIAWGKGLGQYIPITDNTATAIILDHPWAVPPDDSSLLVVRVNRTEIVVTGNHFTDASAAVQLYAQSYGIIVDGNRAERTGGSYGLSWDFWWQAKGTRRYSTCMFNQWLNNDFSEGFTYQQGPWTNGFLGVAADPANGMVEPPAAAMIGNIIRNNTLANGFSIGARLAKPHAGTLAQNKAGYLARDTIIEGNRVSDSPLGIEVTQQILDTVVRHNLVERCATPFSDRGINTWSDQSSGAGGAPKAGQ